MTLSESIKFHRVCFLLTILLLAVLYGSVVPDMVVEWYQNDNYSHGFLVPFIAGFFIYRQRESLAQSIAEPSFSGLAVILFALAQFTAGLLCREHFTHRSSLVVLLAGLVIYFFGGSIFRKTLVPISLLMFMVPLPQIVYNAATFPLRNLATRAAVGFMQLIGMTVIRDGNVIMLPNISLEVVEACSGIRSLLCLLTLSASYAFLLSADPVKRTLIILSAIPLAIFMNALRVIETGIMVHKWGAAMAQGLYHELAGMLVFALSMLFLFMFGKLLCRSQQ